ncbi:tyrosine-protein phosphatase [uncultured Williamsia sp.]|uniref:tyrosine-protein phosphatase n=1 Tax=uncultured Williamsia sp. TaxID=259311 RepID=UPI002603EEBE|nr:tyrosine-protein phosphatase [uncultured Williamsia sp.]
MSARPARAAKSAVVATLALMLGLLGTAAADAAPTTQGVDRSLHLAGAPNARTFQGYTGIDGHVVDDRVIRSDNLSRLTAADVAVLQRRHVTLVVDLRTGFERALQPDRHVPGATGEVRDVLGRAPITTVVDLPSAYRAFVTDPTARAQIAATLRDIAATTAAGHRVLVHCTAGKDRTGWVSAVLLDVLGVGRATIESDYLASNAYRHTSAADPVDGVNRGLLDTSWHLVDARYGGMDGYVRRGLGLDATVISQLRAALLAPAR